MKARAAEKAIVASTTTSSSFSLSQNDVVRRLTEALPLFPFSSSLFLTLNCLTSPPSFFSPTQEDFEAALASSRSLWLSEFEEKKWLFEAEFAAIKAALAAELDVKLEQRRAAKNMIVSLIFILRLIA